MKYAVHDPKDVPLMQYVTTRGTLTGQRRSLFLPMANFRKFWSLKWAGVSDVTVPVIPFQTGFACSLAWAPKETRQRDIILYVSMPLPRMGAPLRVCLPRED